MIPGANGAGAYSDLMFQTFSAQDVYSVSSTLLTDSAPGAGADVAIFAEDSNMGITGIVSTVQRGGMGRTSLEYDLKLRPMFLENGGKFEAYYNDDPTDDATQALFVMEYLYVPPTVNG